MLELINIIEIAILIILPLIIYYQRINEKVSVYIFNILVLYLIWFLTYALLHELSHYIGVWITGVEVLEYQLIPQFWKGDFKTGYLQLNYENKFQEFFIVIMAYIRDLIFMLLVYFIIKRKKIKNKLLGGLVLIILILSPLYDIINNYSAFLLGALNDFNAIKITTNSLSTNLIGITFSAFAIIISLKVFNYIKINAGA